MDRLLVNKNMALGSYIAFLSLSGLRHEKRWSTTVELSSSRPPMIYRDYAQKFQDDLMAMNSSPNTKPINESPCRYVLPHAQWTPLPSPSTSESAHHSTRSLHIVDLPVGETQ